MANLDTINKYLKKEKSHEDVISVSLHLHTLHQGLYIRK